MREKSASRARARNTKHGMRATKTYSIWNGIIARCTRKSSSAYKAYGGVGIGVSERWRKFETFLSDMGECPSAEHTIDRIDNAKGYEQGNCRWATQEQQQNNRRNNRIIALDGERKTLQQWARCTGLSRHKISGRLDRGLPPAVALAP